MNFLSRNKFAFAAIVIVIAGFVWYASSGVPAEPILTTQGIDDTSGAVDQDLISILLTLRAVSLSGTILSDPSFRGLNDFSKQIIQEDTGRPDPFAPLSPSALSPVQSTATGNSGLFKAVSP